MTDIRALAKLFEKSDQQFFLQHAERQAHIRKPYKTEFEQEFQQLGLHEKNRRYILVYKTEHEGKNVLLKIPFLAFADETIEDTDAVLLPIVHEIMQSAKQEMLQ